MCVHILRPSKYDVDAPGVDTCTHASSGRSNTQLDTVQSHRSLTQFDRTRSCSCVKQSCQSNRVKTAQCDIILTQSYPTAIAWPLEGIMTIHVKVMHPSCTRFYTLLPPRPTRDTQAVPPPPPAPPPPYLTVDPEEAAVLGEPWTRRYVYNQSKVGGCADKLRSSGCIRVKG